jgi:acyl phosphate:glycerol-3-phosphate acyltransferase
MNLLLLIVAGYLVGSLSFAVIVSCAMGLPDPHSYGSGNPGATNVLRSGKKLAAVLTLAGDALKGLAVVLVARSLAANAGFGPGDIALGGLAAFLGHLYPVFFGFRGGKGVATAAGVLFGLSAALGGIVLAVWIMVFAISRVSSLGALAAAIAAPIATAFLIGNDRVIGAVVIMTGLLIWRHRDNIRRLRAGAEKRIGAK